MNDCSTRTVILMMHRPFQLQRCLLMMNVQTVGKSSLRENPTCQHLCKRNPRMTAVENQFQHWQRTLLLGRLRPCVMASTIPNEKTQTTTLAVSSSRKLHGHQIRVAVLPYRRSDIFHKWWFALTCQHCLARGLKTVYLSAASKRTCAYRHTSSTSSESSYLRNDNAETTSEGESVDVPTKDKVLSGRRSLSPTERTMLRISCDNEGSSMGQGMDGDVIPPNKSEPSTKLSRDGGDYTGNGSDTTASNVSSRSVGGGGVVIKPNGFQDGPPMVDGEMVIGIRENFKRHEYLNRMFTLNASGVFRSKFGMISHADVVGHLAGRTFTTDLGIDIMIRRPSLDEFVLYMRRTAVISYPKDCCTMLMMIDVSPGDVILEAGTGSGAMTLFLSRAVGPGGCVHTFEAKPDHAKRAVKNVKLWGSSWNTSHPQQPWPENVCFHSGKLECCDKELDSTLLVDGAVIDMEKPHEAMPTLATRLKSGKAAVIYIANITQVIEVAESLRIHSLPLTIEKTLEVNHKVWAVNQARRHRGTSLGEARLATSVESQPDESDFKRDGSSTSVQYITDHVPKYIARPHGIQQGHTAFLVQLRKIECASATYKI